MARPIAGGDDHLPPMGPGGGRAPPAPRPFAVKRRTDDDDPAGGDDGHEQVFRLKRPKYIQYNAPYPSPDDHVAFTAVEVHRRPSPQPPAHPHHHNHNHPHHHNHTHNHTHNHNNNHHAHHNHAHHNHPPSHEPSPTPPLETTTSGHTIHPTPPPSHLPRSASTELLSDSSALHRVRTHMSSFRRRFPDSKHERILRSIIRPRHPHDESPLDNDSLQSILSAANEVFFNGRLSQRVMWDWSSTVGGDGGRVGTTALRRASTRGYETLIVLSGPVLRGGGFSRRLLISTFLHELVHCYLFICCGFRAREEGGHTRGFREIVRLIDEWAGEESGLHLGSVVADLERFRIGTAGGEGEGHQHDDLGHRRHVYYPCSGVTEEERHRAPLPLPSQGGQRTPVVDDEESISSGTSGYASTWWRHQAGALDHDDGGWEEGEDRDSGFDSGGASGSGSPYVYTTADGMSWGG